MLMHTAKESTNQYQLESRYLIKSSGFTPMFTGNGERSVDCGWKFISSIVKLFVSSKLTCWWKLNKTFYLLTNSSKPGGVPSPSDEALSTMAKIQNLFRICTLCDYKSWPYKRFIQCLIVIVFVFSSKRMWGIQESPTFYKLQITSNLVLCSRWIIVYYKLQLVR